MCSAAVERQEGVQKVKELWLKSFKKETQAKKPASFGHVLPQETPSEEEWPELLRCNPEASKLVAARNASAGGYLTTCSDYASSIGPDAKQLPASPSCGFKLRLTNVVLGTSDLSQGASIPSLLVNGKVGVQVLRSVGRAVHGPL